MPIQCPKCERMVAALPIHRCPPVSKGEPMPQTVEYLQQLAVRDLKLIMEQKEEISRLKQTANNLRQKVESLQDRLDAEFE